MSTTTMALRTLESTRGTRLPLRVATTACSSRRTTINTSTITKKFSTRIGTAAPITTRTGTTTKTVSSAVTASAVNRNNSHCVPKSFLFGSMSGFVGCLVGGVSGSLLMVPALTSSRLVARLSKPQAHGTSLVAVAATGIAGTIAYWDDVDHETATIIALSGMLTGRAGAILGTRISQGTLRKVMGAFFLSLSPLILPIHLYNTTPCFNGNNKSNVTGATNNSISSTVDIDKPTSVASWSSPSSSTTTMQRYLVPAGIGCCSGFLAGMFGIASGAVIVPALTALGRDGDFHQVIGTSISALVFPAVTGAATHIVRGTVSMRVAPALAVGAFTGGLVGGYCGKMMMTEQELKTVFASWTAILGLFKLVV